MFTHPRLEINLSYIVQNYDTFAKARSNPNTQMACVVKDDAYGLGSREISDALYRAGCRLFFVAQGNEGHIVRSVAPDAKIYVLQGVGKEDLSYFISDRLIPVINSPAQLTYWKTLGRQEIPLAFQVETGLNRLGFRPSEIAELSDADRLQTALLVSHLACADEPDHPLNLKQLEAFRKLTPLFPNAQFSLSASDGFLLGERFQFDVVRLGAVLYGLNPVPNVTLKSRNVIRLTAPVLQISAIRAGESIGYGADYVMKKAGKIAIVSIGYGDGVLRSFFPKGQVWFENDGKRFRAPLVGRVSMDNLICDVSDVPEAVLAQSPYAILIDDAYTADDFGRDAGTIGYEILSTIGHGIRSIRTYL